MITVWLWLRRWRWGMVALVIVGAAPLAQRWLPVAIGAVIVALGSAVFDVLWERMRQERQAHASTADSILTGRVSKLNNPGDLGVKPAPALNRSGASDSVPPYIERDVTTVFRTHLGHSGFVLLTGDSTAGLTREAYEGVRAVLPKHFLIRPRPSALKEALALAERKRKCVLWLDELDQYVNGLDRLALRRLIDRPNRHIVVVATATNQFLQQSKTADASAAEAVRRVNEVLDLAEGIAVARMWSQEELNRAGAAIADPRIEAALADSASFGVAQHLAAGEELVRRWRSGQLPVTNEGHPLGVAIVDAVVAARRNGYYETISEDLLRQLVQPYLSIRSGDHTVTESWEEALEWATHVDRRIAGSGMVLRRDGGYRAFTYLVEVNDKVMLRRMPEQVWRALLDHADAETASSMALAAAVLGDLDRSIAGMMAASDRGDYASAITMALVQGRPVGTKVGEWLSLELADAERDFGPDHEDTQALRALSIICNNLDNPPLAASLLGDLLDNPPMSDHADLRDLRLNLKAMQARLHLDGGDTDSAAAVWGEIVAVATAAGDMSLAERAVLQVGHLNFLGRAGRWGTAAPLAIQLVAELTVHHDLGPLAPITLHARQACAHALLHAGKRDVAIGRLEGLLVDCVRVLGNRNRVTLWTRMVHAEAVEFADRNRARHLWLRLVADTEEILGAADLQTMEIRMHQLDVVRRLEDHDELLRLEHDFIAEQTGIHGERSFRTLELRRQYAEDLATAGRHHDALELWEEVLADYTTFFGDRDRRTLNAHGHRIDELAETGLSHQAAVLADELVGVVDEAVASNDYLRAEAISRAARLLAAAGNHPVAADRYAELAALYQDWYGSQQVATLNARYNHAVQTGMSGRPADAASALAPLAAAYAHLRGWDDDAVWGVRMEHARWVAVGEPGSGAELYEQIATDRGTVLDPTDHVQFNCLIRAIEAWFQAGQAERAFAIANGMQPYVQITFAEPDDDTDRPGEIAA